MRKNKFLAALAIAACLATSVPFSVNAATPGQAKDASKVTYGTVSTANQAIIQKLFDATYYAKENPDLAKAGITTEAALFNHFVKFGIFEGRACCEGFNVAAYKSSYSDLQAAFGDDIVAYYVHYVTFGQTEKRALVTVEAATAAGVTVKSAADGTVVAAGAAKPAAGGAAASSGSATSSDGKKEEEKQNVGDENEQTVNAGTASASVINTVGVETVSTLKNGKLEVVFANGIDYDYAGKFYNFKAGKIDTAYGVRMKDGYVKADGAFRYLQDIYSSINSERFKSVGGDKYIDLTKKEDLSKHQIQDYDHSLYVYSSQYGCFMKVAKNYEQYWTDDGAGNRVWNIKTVSANGVREPQWAVWKDNNKNSVIFRSTTPRANGVITTPSKYLRVKNGQYYTTYHYSNDADNTNANTAAMGTDMDDNFAVNLTSTGAGITLEEAVYKSVYSYEGQGVWHNYDNTRYFASVVAAADCVLGEQENVYAPHATAGYRVVKAYEKADAISKACDMLDNYKEVDGYVVHWDKNNNRPYAYNPTQPIMQSGWVAYTPAGSVTTYAYEKIDRDVALNLSGYTVYNGGQPKSFKVPNATFTGYSWSDTGWNKCYKTGDAKTETEACAENEVVLDPSTKNVKYVENFTDCTFYPVKTDLATIFGNVDPDSVVQFTKNGRFYNN